MELAVDIVPYYRDLMDMTIIDIAQVIRFGNAKHKECALAISK